jgi:hypothetical protein
MPGPAGATFYIGGSPCAGKSTIADLLARRHDLHAFHCDEGAEPRLALVRRSPSQAIRQLVALPDCDRLSRPPAWQAEQEVNFYREQFPYLLEELRTAPRPGVAEGADLLPELLHQAGIPFARAVWVVPTPRFQLEHYARRPWAHDYVAACPDPPAAFANWMERDARFAGHVAAQAARLGGKLLVVDGSRPVDDVAAEVARHFGLGAGRLSQQPSP